MTVESANETKFEKYLNAYSAISLVFVLGLIAASFSVEGKTQYVIDLLVKLFASQSLLTLFGPGSVR